MKKNTQNKQSEIDTTKLTFVGSMNYVVQAFRIKDTETGEVTCFMDQYQPRKNRIYTGDVDETKLIKDMTETLERMKIAQQIMQDFIDGKCDKFYFWQIEEERQINVDLHPNYY